MFYMMFLPAITVIKVIRLIKIPFLIFQLQKSIPIANLIYLLNNLKRKRNCFK